MDDDLIVQIYEAAADEAVFNHLPELIAERVGARSCSIFEFDNDLVLKSAIANYLTPDMLAYQLSVDIKPLDIWTEYGARKENRTRICNTEDIWDQPTFLRTPYFNEYFRKFGDDTSRCVGGVAPVHGGFVSLAIHNGICSRSFDGTDVHNLSQFSAHVFRMLDLRSRLRVAEAHSSQLQAALDSRPEGVLAVDAAMQILAMNRRGQEMVVYGRGLRCLGRKLTAAHLAVQGRLRVAVEGAARLTGGFGDAFLLPRNDGGMAYRVVVTPLAGNPGIALVLVEDPSDREPDARQRLARLFGLTTAEADLAALLVEGRTPEEAANMREVSLTTVRTQIKQLLLKTEARRLTDLVRILARTPRIQRP